MVGPIRHFCQNRLETLEVLRSGLTLFYAEMINNFMDFTDSVGHAVILAELGNMRAVFVQTCKHHRVDHLVVCACIMYTNWSLYVGSNPEEEVICFVMKDAEGPPSLLAGCHSTLSAVYIWNSKLDEAQASCKHAIELHRQAHSVLGEAHSVQRLGDVQFRSDKLDEAQASFKHAIELHRQAHDILGEANDVQKLGDVKF
jgi:Tetratricopeptide repeat